MATLYKRKESPNWYCKFSDADGKRVSANTGCTQKREALKQAKRLEADALTTRAQTRDLQSKYALILEAAARDAQAGDLTLARAETLLHRLRAYANPSFRELRLDEWMDEWLDECSSKKGSASTQKGRREAWGRFKRALGANAQMKLSEIQPKNIRRALDTVATKVRSSTANLDLGHIKRALQQAADDGLINESPARRIKALKTTDKTLRIHFEPEEVRRLIDNAPDEMAGCVTIAAHTGLRFGDVVELKSSNIVGTDLHVKTAKTGAVVRIPMSPPIIAWTSARKGALFPELSAMSKSARAMRFGALMKKAGVPAEVELPTGETAKRSFHSLRHSFITWLAEADVHSDVRQALSAHSSASIHANYTHHDESLKKAVGTLPEL